MEYDQGIRLDRIEQKLDYLIELITTPQKLPENENNEEDDFILKTPTK